MELEENSGPVFCAPAFPGGLGSSGSGGGLSYVVVGGLGNTPDHFERERGNDFDPTAAGLPGPRLQLVESRCAEVRSEWGRVTRSHGANGTRRLT